MKLKKQGWKGTIETGMKRAKQLAYDDNIDIEDAIVMNAWFARHKYTSKPGYDKWKKDEKPMDISQKNKRRGVISWLSWGGNPGYRWINSKKIQDAIKKYKIGKNEKYVPKSLSKSDRKKQIESIFYGRDRPQLRSFKSKKSKWTEKAEKYFKGDTSLSNMTKILDVPLKSLREIIKKGKGAYYTSGSRPNQTPESWGRGRLYSVLFGGPSRDIDKKIVDKYDIPLLK